MYDFYLYFSLVDTTLSHLRVANNQKVITENFQSDIK